MNLLSRRWAMLPAALVMALLSAASQANPEVVRARLKAAIPEAEITSIKLSPSGLYEVVAKGYETIHVTADGRYLFQGDLYELQGNRIVNASDVQMAGDRQKRLAAVSDSDEVVFPAAGGKPKAIVHVFTDIDCGYCRKLHQEVSAMNRLGIEVRYLAFPRTGPVSPSATKLNAVWCAKDRQSAMTRAKAGESVTAAKSCKAPAVAAQYALGEELGVRGTPAIFGPDGMQLGGYVSAESLAKSLGIR
ncbi:MAG: DsbC family protein [Moraxellaceae bacterium]|nr:DsbC family protein [Moraxellaceae bacterium]